MKNLRALNTLGEPTDSWDTLIIYMVVSKLDAVTEREWEQHKVSTLSQAGDSKPGLKVDDLLKFLGKHHFTTLLFRDEHLRQLQAAPQALLYTLRETWWPVRGRDAARRTVHRCTSTR
ncbi:hypothetical protein JYU34_018477 [Plutella xylostella]|uniref:Uncharacterized protein n=1 Tax=Plutella xylostella TaxID=51655 RepID=A0ABQ7PYE5_PLUXY|nr:hypothetical protein JYU34_018477 [Plutella xylostella]